MQEFFFTVAIFLTCFCSAQTVSCIFSMHYLNSHGASKEPLVVSYEYSNKISLQRLIAGGGTKINDALIADEYGNTH